MYSGLWSTTGQKCSQLNPKFPLNRPHTGCGHGVASASPSAPTSRLWTGSAAGRDIFKRLFDLIDELSAEFATDPPCQPTLAGAASRQYDGELRGNVEIFGDYLHASLRHVRDRAVARQQAGPELDPREAT